LSIIYIITKQTLILIHKGTKRRNNMLLVVFLYWFIESTAKSNERK